MSYRLSIDIGGTFTDSVLLNEETGEIRYWKSPSTPADYSLGVMDSIEKIDTPLDKVVFFTHGTTVGINALIQGKAAPTGLITTKGWRDSIAIGRSNRIEMYDPLYQKPRPLVPRRYRCEVTERLDYKGDVMTELVKEDVHTAAKIFKDAKLPAVAICLLNSYVKPNHEEIIKEIVRDSYPEAFISISSDITREYREYERTCTTILNASLMPIVSRYLALLEEKFVSAGYPKGQEIYIMQSNGGIMASKIAKELPVYTVESGQAGGIIGLHALSNLLGLKNTIGADMGGTSFDVELVVDGAIGTKKMMKIKTPTSGHDAYPALVPTLDIHAIGAGGGSIAWIDDGGSLHVGPQSAGADPGPACYNRGGTEPTVTDADLVIGRIPNELIGGEMKLDIELAKKAVQKIADFYGMDLTQAAYGILKIVNTNMAGAIRSMTIRQGLDPREFTLVAFGGAGPMHAVDIARELEIPQVLVVQMPGNFSAWGMLMAELKHDYVYTYSYAHLKPMDEIDFVELNDVFENLENKARVILEREGVREENMRFIRGLDIRYLGQEHTLTVHVATKKLDDTDKQFVADRFDDLHEKTYLHAAREQPKEIVTVRVTAIGSLKKPVLQKIKAGTETQPADAIKARRDVYFDTDGEYVSTPIYDRAKLLANNVIEGPAIIEEALSTTVLLPGKTLRVDEYGHLIIKMT